MIDDKFLYAITQEKLQGNLRTLEEEEITKSLYDKLLPLQPTTGPLSRYSNQIHVFWNSGEGNLPDILEPQYNHVKELYHASLHFVDYEQSKKIMPSWAVNSLEKGELCIAHYSNILRLRLIYVFGGTWMDMDNLPRERAIDRYMNRPLWGAGFNAWGSVSYSPLVLQFLNFVEDFFKSDEKSNYPYIEIDTIFKLILKQCDALILRSALELNSMDKNKRHLKGIGYV